MEEGSSYGDALSTAQELGYAEPDPTNDVAVIIPAPASIPVELIVTADPTIALVDVVTPVTTAPSGNVGETPVVLPLKFVTLKSDIRDPKFEGHQ